MDTNQIVLDKEALQAVDRAGYEEIAQDEEETLAWEAEAAWPE